MLIKHEHENILMNTPNLGETVLAGAREAENDGTGTNAFFWSWTNFLAEAAGDAAG